MYWFYSSTGEAVEQVLREKKISNKLNYDVLKSLNMDDFVKSIDFDSTDEENNKLVYYLIVKSCIFIFQTNAITLT